MSLSVFHSISYGYSLTVDFNLQTEFMVDMKCDGCVKSVRSKLEPLDGKIHDSFCAADVPLKPKLRVLLILEISEFF